MRRRHSHARGFGLIEALVASALCVGVLVALVGAFGAALHASQSNTKRLQAAFLEEEGLEAMRLLRDSSWNTNIASTTIGVPFYLTFNGTAWQTSAQNVYIDGVFERRITLYSVYRDVSQNIVLSGGTLDSNMRRVVVSVSWKEGTATTTKSLTTYLANVFRN